MGTMRLLALLAFACFLAYLSVFLIRVRRVDIYIVIGLTLLLVGYDLWKQLGPQARNRTPRKE